MDKKHTIDTVTAGIMLGVALILDGLQALLTIASAGLTAIPIAGLVLGPASALLTVPLSWFLSVGGLFGFWLWFKLAGVKYDGGNGGRKLLIMAATTITEFAPLINGLPGTTAGVVGIVVQTRIEDARRAAGGKVTPRTAQAALRLERMHRMQAARAGAARESREKALQAKHSPANDNEPEEMRRAA